MRLIDLHTHSTSSDGSDTPTELIEKAKKIGLAAIALTDHDTIEGLAEAQEASQAAGIEFVRGCEISTATDQGNMHMLGLWLPRDCPTLDAFLAHLRQRREDRNLRLVAKLNQAGINVSFEEVAEKAGHKDNIGRPHFAAVMLAKGHVENLGEAFDKWLGIGGAAYVPKVAPRPEQALRILQELGATTILAHPLLRPRPEGWLEKLVSGLAGLGLDGLEAWHSAQDEEQSRQILELGQKHGMVFSGGSDYHGKNKKDVSLASGKGNLRVTLDVLDNLKAHRKAKGLPC